MKIGILVCGHMSAPMAKWQSYDVLFAELLAGHGFEFTAYFVVDGELPPSPEAQDGWIVSGSKHSTYEDLPWIAPVEQFLRAAFTQKRPIVGICFGHQLLAQALGGLNEKFDGGWQIGRQCYDLNGSGSCAIMAWHQDQVTRVPEMAEVIGSAASCANAVLHYPERALTFQAHPEFSAAFTRDLLEKRGADLPEELKSKAAAHMDEPLDSGIVAEMMAHFLRHRALRSG